jgi:hypothetical protein
LPIARAASEAARKRSSSTSWSHVSANGRCSRPGIGFTAIEAILALLAVVGAIGAQPPPFCGLARTVNGFDAVRAEGLSCGAARHAIVAIEQGRRGDWGCSRSVGGAIELDCRDGLRRIEVLERSPVPAVRRRDGSVRLANWLFRVRARRLEAREDGSDRWLRIAGPPWCVPFAPREALVALRLRPLTPSGGCFAPRG